MKTELFRKSLDQRQQSLSFSPEASALLDALCHNAPEFCLQALVDTSTHPTQKTQLLARLVRTGVERRRLAEILHALPDIELLQVLDGLRTRRINGQRARRVGLTALLEHERLAELAASHRKRLAQIIRHLVGEQTWSSVRRFLKTPSIEGNEFINRVVLRFAADVDKAREVLCFLAGLGLDAAQPVRKPWLTVPWITKPVEARRFQPKHPALQQSLAARRSLEAGEGMPRETLFGIRGN